MYTLYTYIYIERERERCQNGKEAKRETAEPEETTMPRYYCGPDLKTDGIGNPDPNPK